MTITNGYCTLAEFKAWITVRGATISADTADDAVMEQAIESVSRKIDDLTGRRFWKNSSAETRYFQTEDAFHVDVTDLVSVANLYVDYVDTRSYTELASTDYELFPANAALDSRPYDGIDIAPNSSAYFPSGRRGVKISGVFGWNAVPVNIKEACMSIAHNVWMTRSGQTSGGKVSITAGGVVIRPEDIPDHVMQNLMTYRRFV